MSTTSALRVATRTRLPSLASRTVQRRFLDTATAPSLYKAHVKVHGARKGHVDGENLKVDLTMAKALGGPGDKGKTNPEELFAAGYAACFQSAMNACAMKMGVTLPADSVVEATVHLVGDMKALDMGLRVDMDVHVSEGIERSTMEEIVGMAKEVCPYSRATRGNVATTVNVV